MFNSLASYLLGTTSVDPVPEATELRLTSMPGDDDWVLIDRTGSAGESDTETSIESIGDIDDDAVRIITRTSSSSSIQRSSSCSSLPCTSIEESWFITPPPCFTSAGPIHMETSPLENLLIEHPSMSVYQHSTNTTLMSLRRHNSAPSSASSVHAEDQEVDRLEDTAATPYASVVTGNDREVPRPNNPRPHQNNLNHSLRQQQERQCLNVRNAQKVSL